MALLPNAKDYYAERARNVRIRDVTDYFKTLGYDPVIFDLRNYKTGRAIKKTLEQFDFIWATGGNTFILRYEMQKSGFDTIIKQLLDGGKIYGGDSAGACVAGNSLTGIEFADDPEFSEGVEWQGLKLIDKYILPHVGSTGFGSGIEEARELHKNDQTLLELTDTQAVVVNGNDVKIVNASLA